MGPRFLRRFAELTLIGSWAAGLAFLPAAGRFTRKRRGALSRLVAWRAVSRALPGPAAERLGLYARLVIDPVVLRSSQFSANNFVTLQRYLLAGEPEQGRLLAERFRHAGTTSLRMGQFELAMAGWNRESRTVGVAERTSCGSPKARISREGAALRGTAGASCSRRWPAGRAYLVGLALRARARLSRSSSSFLPSEAASGSTSLR